MKKNWISFLLLVCLLLSGCSGAEVPQKPAEKPKPEPVIVYDEAPKADVGYDLKVNGIPLAVYGGDVYLSLNELIAAVGGEVQTVEGEKNHTATYQLGEQTVALSNQAGELYTGKDWFVKKELLTQLGYESFGDIEQNTVYYTTYPKHDAIPEGVKIPTLMYHAVSDNCWGIQSLFVSPKRMEEQIKFLTENGYTPILFEDLGRADQIEKPILLTFDDGYDDNYTELFPLLKKYNVKATVFVITDLLGTEHYMTREQVKEMSDSGLVSIQSHTVTHPYLSDCTKQQLETELYQSKLEIARITGKTPFVLCYPSGRYSDASLAKTAEHYEYGLLMNGTIYETGDAPYRINRKFVGRGTTLNQFKSLIGI